VKYLASPYTHKDPAVMQARYNRVVDVQTKLYDEGHAVFCPIAHSHEAQCRMTAFRKDQASFWLDEIDIPLMDVCDELLILTLDGWAVSFGVGEEIRAADWRNMVITYIDEDCNEVKP